MLPHHAGGKARIEANEGVRAKLANIMSYHVVRPVPGYEAFTTPFMGQGTELQVGTGERCVWDQSSRLCGDIDVSRAHMGHLRSSEL